MYNNYIKVNNINIEVYSMGKGVETSMPFYLKYLTNIHLFVIVILLNLHFWDIDCGDKLWIKLL